jgi:hypothetical protein
MALFLILRGRRGGLLAPVAPAIASNRLHESAVLLKPLQGDALINHVDADSLLSSGKHKNSAGEGLPMGRDDVGFELDDIKRELKRIEENLKKIMEDQVLIKNETRALLAEETKVEGKLTRMKFSDITSWRSAIWENCSNKESKAGEIAISYWCKKLGAPCRFEDCPLNHYS